MPKPPIAPAPFKLPSATVVAWAALVLALLLAVNQVVLVRRVAALKPGSVATQQRAEPANGSTLEKGKFVAVSAKEPRLGSADAKYTLIEYSDMDCPFCTRWHRTVEQVIQEQPTKLSKVFRHLPLESIHPKARPQNEAIACVQQESPAAAWGTINAVFARKPASWTQDEVVAAAVTAGANEAAVRSCISAGTGTQIVNEHIAQVDELGASGTPFSLLVGPDGSARVISGAAAKAQLEALLN